MNRKAASSIEIVVYLIIGIAAALAIFVFGIPAIMRTVSSGTNALKSVVIPEYGDISTIGSAIGVLLQDNVEAALDSYDKTATAQFQDDYSKLTNVNDKINYFYNHTKLLINTLSDGLKKKGESQGVQQYYELSQELDANKAYALANLDYTSLRSSWPSVSYDRMLTSRDAFQKIIDNAPSTFAAVQKASQKIAEINKWNCKQYTTLADCNAVTGCTGVYDFTGLSFTKCDFCSSINDCSGYTGDYVCGTNRCGLQGKICIPFYSENNNFNCLDCSTTTCDQANSAKVGSKQDECNKLASVCKLSCVWQTSTLTGGSCISQSS